MTKLKILVKSKNHDFLPNFRNIEAKPDFFTIKARLVFIKLRKMFIKALILNNFDPECYIQIKIYTFGYAITKILGQLTSNYLSK